MGAALTAPGRRRGNRRPGHAIHMAPITQIRKPRSADRATLTWEREALLQPGQA